MSSDISISDSSSSDWTTCDTSSSVCDHSDSSLNTSRDSTTDTSSSSEVDFNQMKDLGSDLANGLSLNLKSLQIQDYVVEIERLRMDLENTKHQLFVKTRECQQLSEMQGLVDTEIHELTGSLFEEAYNRVNEANTQRSTSERLLKEANGKIDVLQAEVNALKALVLTSTPSSPGPAVCGSRSPFSKRNKKDVTPISAHRRINSDGACLAKTLESDEEKEKRSHLEFKQVDLMYKSELDAWCNSGSGIDCKTHPFLRRIYNEEISPCLAFNNTELSTKILHSAEANCIVMEPLSADEKTVSRICALSQLEEACDYRLKLDDSDEKFLISRACRNRIAAVCDMLTYLRYIKQGLVKRSAEDMYWEVIRLRKNLSHAKLGLGFSSFNHQ